MIALPLGYPAVSTHWQQAQLLNQAAGRTAARSHNHTKYLPVLRQVCQAQQPEFLAADAS